MTGSLLDTNVISEFVRPLPDPQVMSRIRQIESRLIFVSAMTFGELRFGIEQLPIGRRRNDLEHWLETGLPSWFTSNLLPIDRNTMDIWARISVQARRKGTPLNFPDAMIAATAVQHGLTLVTRNVKHFTPLGIALVNPWEPQP